MRFANPATRLPLIICVLVAIRACRQFAVAVLSMSAGLVSPYCNTRQ